MTRGIRLSAVLFGLSCVAVLTLSPGEARPGGDRTAPKVNQGQGIVLELTNDFIKSHMNRALMESQFRVDRVGSVHSAKKDGEAHVAGVAEEARLATVIEVMNAEDEIAALSLLRKAARDRQSVKVRGAWRFWCEHAGTRNQKQGDNLPNRFPDSNPDHVFEIHPVTSVGELNLSDSVKATPGFEPKEAERAFRAYENVPCRIERLPGNRTRITTKSVGFNFTEFVIRLNEDPIPIEDGHLVLASVRDLDNELLVRNRRMVFMKGTKADQAVANLGEGDFLRVIGIPRISLRLIHWRTENGNDENQALTWDLPYEMIIVSAKAFRGDDD